MDDKTVTIKDIAQMAGVHRATVDKVLHDRPGVSDEVRARVKRIIRTLDYQPNAIGRALKQQDKSQVVTIAAVMVSVCSAEQLKDGLYDAAEEFGRFGFRLSYQVTRYDQPEAQARMLDELAQPEVSGVILQPCYHPDVTAAIHRLTERGIPVVTVNTDIPEGDQLCYVGQDAVAAARTAARLVQMYLNGRGRIAILSGSLGQLHASSQRAEEFTRYLAEIAPQIEVLESVRSMEDETHMFHSTLELLKRHERIDCLYVTTGGTGGVAMAIQDAGKTGQTRIVCFDLYPDVIEQLHNGCVFATIGQELRRQGYLAFKILYNLLFLGKRPASRDHYTDVDIRMKENTFIKPRPS